MGFLPSRKNIILPAGDAFFQEDGAPRAGHLGYMSGFTWTPTVEVEDIFVSNSGVRTKIGDREKDVSVAISLTLQEMRPDILAKMMAGTIKALTQASATALVVEVENAAPGELIDLGALDVENVAVQINGADAPSGTYTLYRSAGKIMVRTAGDYEIVFDAKAISANRAVVTILNKTGLEGVFTVIQNQPDSTAYMLRDFRATLRPNAEIPLLTDGSSIPTLTLAGSGTYNEANPDKPWGELVELAAA